MHCYSAPNGSKLLVGYSTVQVVENNSAKFLIYGTIGLQRID